MGIKSVMRVIKNADVIQKKSIEIFEQKKRALMQGDEALKYQVGEGKDIMSILCQLQLVRHAISGRLADMRELDSEGEHGHLRGGSAAGR